MSSEPKDDAFEQSVTPDQPVQLELEMGHEHSAQNLVHGSAILPNQTQFTTDFLELQNPNGSSGRLMYAFIRRTLQQFHLQSNYREACILNEAYLRGLRQIRRGQLIHNAPAWLRSTSYNIIRELKRDQQKAVSLQDQMLEMQPAPVASDDLEDDLATLRLAFQLLSKSDQKLLNLKIVDGYSWGEIRAILDQQGYGDHDEAKLRKRKERALIRLRKKFHALKPHEFKEKIKFR
jgi:DNA-directed RNA polymerase specialized sigma24 family protein